MIICDKDNSGKYVEQTVECEEGMTCVSFSSGAQQGCAIKFKDGAQVKEGDIVNVSCKDESLQAYADKEYGFYPALVIEAHKADDNKFYGTFNYAESVCVNSILVICQIDQKNTDYRYVMPCGKSCTMHPQTETELMYGLCDKPNAIEGCNETISGVCAKTEATSCYTDTNGFGNCTKACSDGDKDELSCNESGTYLLTDTCEDVAGKKMFVTSNEKCTTKCDDSGDAPVCK